MTFVPQVKYLSNSCEVEPSHTLRLCTSDVEMSNLHLHVPPCASIVYVFISVGVSPEPHDSAVCLPPPILLLPETAYSSVCVAAAVQCVPHVLL